MRLVSTQMLRPNMVLARPIYQNGTLILSAGRAKLTNYIQNLTNLGIHYVYVEDEISKGIEIPDAISEETRQACKVILRSTLEGCVNGEPVSFLKLNESIESIIDEVLNNKGILISLNDIGVSDEYTYSHSVSVAVYAMLIGKALNFSRDKLKDLAMGTLLHDIGKITLDQKILYKEGKLTEDEFDYVKQHAIAGQYVLDKNHSIPSVVKMIANSHHERMDGLGYPCGKKGDELHLYTKIAAIADVYDALTTDRCYRPKWAANKAVDYMIQNSGTQFSADLVQVFIQQIAIFPNGSMVLLSNGEIGIVKEQNKNVPFRPVVRIVKDCNGEDITPYEINLMEALNITIEESELEIIRNNRIEIAI